MKKSMLYLLSIALTSILFVSCKDDAVTSPVSTASVATKTTLYFPTVTAAPGPNGFSSPSIGATCDQLTVSSVRILISNLKLLHDEADTIGSGVMKAGPFVAYFQQGQTVTASNISIPPGTFDRVKFEMHKFNPSLDSIEGSAQDISDFTSSERNTIIIEGTVYSNGAAIPFIYKSRMTANVQDVLEAPLSITTDPSGYTVFIDFYPPSVFMTSQGQVLDPRDPTNAAAIDAAIKMAFVTRSHLGA